MLRHSRVLRADTDDHGYLGSGGRLHRPRIQSGAAVNHPEPTRRWVLQLGAGTVLTGFSGIPAIAATPLPAGLYLPSTDHLAHILKSASTARPLAAYTPQFFSPSEVAIVRRIVALLLGDIPEANDVIADIV